MPAHPAEPFPRQPPLPDRLDALDRTAPARAPVARSSEADDGRRTAPRPGAPGAGGEAAHVEVRYGLDPLTNVWIAQLFDGESGRLVRSVPATHLMHQLAALRELADRRLDRTA